MSQVIKKMNKIIGFLLLCSTLLVAQSNSTKAVRDSVIVTMRLDKSVYRVSEKPRFTFEIENRKGYAVCTNNITHLSMYLENPVGDRGVITCFSTMMDSDPMNRPTIVEIKPSKKRKFEFEMGLENIQFSDSTTIEIIVYLDYTRYNPVFSYLKKEGRFENYTDYGLFMKYIKEMKISGLRFSVTR